VFGPDEDVEQQRTDHGKQNEHPDDGARHPRKMSTMSLAPDVVSR
jgi:hypothetical protein